MNSRAVGSAGRSSGLGLGIEPVDPDDLRAVLAGLAPGTGESPNGGPPRMWKNRVPGFDLTVSVPKTVSVLYALGDPLVAGDERLRARLVLSILALPSHTVFAVMPRRSSFDDPNFDAVLDWADASELTSVVQFGRPRRRVSDDARRRSVDRLAPSSEVEVVDDERTRRLRDRYWEAIGRARSIDVSQDHLVSHAPRLSRAALNTRLRDLVSISVPAEYEMHDGVIYPTEERLPQHELWVDELRDDSAAFDSQKPRRAAALAGWRVADAQSMGSEDWYRQVQGADFDAYGDELEDFDWGDS